jgi:hypothetical protein
VAGIYVVVLVFWFLKLSRRAYKKEKILSTSAVAQCPNCQLNYCSGLGEKEK